MSPAAQDVAAVAMVIYGLIVLWVAFRPKK
jgi:hypothetical protein